MCSWNVHRGSIDAHIGMCVHVSVPLTHRCGCCDLCCTSRGSLAVVMLLLWEPQLKSQVFPWQTTLRHTKTPPAGWDYSEAWSSHGARCVGRTFCYFSPPLLLFGTGRNVWKRRREGAGVPALHVSLSLPLFGEFADDTDQCSIFILKTLVVCSQINKNLVVKMKLMLKYVMFELYT